MASYNRVVLVGNTTRDVELRKIPSGTEVCDLGLAVNERRRDAQGNQIEDTTFVDVTLWGKTAFFAESLLLYVDDRKPDEYYSGYKEQNKGCINSTLKRGDIFKINPLNSKS